MATSGGDQIYKTALMFAVTLLATATVQLIDGVMGDDPQVPCYFIFGDSLADNGNNNVLLTVAKANYKPYGIDFPGGLPTGRFSNGLNTVDFIGETPFYPSYYYHYSPVLWWKKFYVP